LGKGGREEGTAMARAGYWCHLLFIRYFSSRGQKKKRKGKGGGTIGIPPSPEVPKKENGRKAVNNLPDHVKHVNERK